MAAIPTPLQQGSVDVELGPLTPSRVLSTPTWTSAGYAIGVSNLEASAPPTLPASVLLSVEINQPWEAYASPEIIELQGGSANQQISVNVAVPKAASASLVANVTLVAYLEYQGTSDTDTASMEVAVRQYQRIILSSATHLSSRTSLTGSVEVQNGGNAPDGFSCHQPRIVSFPSGFRPELKPLQELPISALPRDQVRFIPIEVVLAHQVPAPAGGSLQVEVLCFSTDPPSYGKKPEALTRLVWQIPDPGASDLVMETLLFSPALLAIVIAAVLGALVWSKRRSRAKPGPSTPRPRPRLKHPPQKEEE